MFVVSLDRLEFVIDYKGTTASGTTLNDEMFGISSGNQIYCWPSNFQIMLILSESTMQEKKGYENEENNKMGVAWK